MLKGYVNKRPFEYVKSLFKVQKKEKSRYFLLAVYLMTPSNVRTLSLIHLVLMKPVWSSDISSGKAVTVLIRFAMAFGAIL